MANLIARDKTSIAPTAGHGLFGHVRRICNVLTDRAMYRIAPTRAPRTSFKWPKRVGELNAAPSVLMPQ